MALRIDLFQNYVSERLIGFGKKLKQGFLQTPLWKYYYGSNCHSIPIPIS